MLVSKVQRLSVMLSTKKTVFLMDTIESGSEELMVEVFDVLD